jgi:hypothetical protein
VKLNLRVLAVAVAVALGMLGAIQLANPVELGISAVTARWLGIVATGLGILATFLPRVTGPTTDPVALADRIMGLDRENRLKVLTELESRRLSSPSPPPTPPDSRDPFRDLRLG